MARTWALPPDPADEGVTELWNEAGTKFVLQQHTGLWWLYDRSQSWTWPELVYEEEPLSDTPPPDVDPEGPYLIVPNFDPPKPPYQLPEDREHATSGGAG